VALTDAAVPNELTFDAHFDKKLPPKRYYPLIFNFALDPAQAVSAQKFSLLAHVSDMIFAFHELTVDKLRKLYLNNPETDIGKDVCEMAEPL